MKTLIAMLSLILLDLVIAGRPPQMDNKLDNELDNELDMDKMTIEELKEVFNADPDAVPNYEVVSIDVPEIDLESDDKHMSLSLNAFGRKVDFRLKPTDGILAGKNTPVYLVGSSPGSEAGYSVTVKEDAMSKVGILLENEEKKASILVKKTRSGTNSIYGKIGSENWAVRPLPRRFVERLSKRRRRSASYENEIDDDYVTGDHVIYESRESSDESHHMAPLSMYDIFNTGSRSAIRSPPSIVYPQILVVVDAATYELHDTLDNLLEYLVLFWNGVDLKYRSLETTKVQLNIAGVVVATDFEALSFMSDNKVSRETLNVPGALRSFSFYMKNFRRYLPSNSYDIAVAMGPYEMCAPSNYGYCKSGPLGIAYVSGACSSLGNSKITLSVAVIQDKGTFDGVHTAAHELGHLFGADHDNARMGAGCSVDAGYIMAPRVALTEKSVEWSQCSLKAFDKFFRSESASCLLNKPDTTGPLARVLPGRTMTMDEQCMKLRGTNSCQWARKDICRRLTCALSNGEYGCIATGHSPADGTTCGSGKICINGKCVYDTHTEFS